MGRQERRIKLKQSIEEISRRGMDLSANGTDRTWAVAAATRILMDILSGRSGLRASAAAKRANAFFETSLKRNSSHQSIACGKGCAFCCYMTVTVTAPEIFHVANVLREQYKDNPQSILARVRSADEKTRNLSVRERQMAKIPCALLEDNACSVYPDRPGVCRGLVSISARACERAYNGQDSQIETPAVWTSLRNAQKQALWAALDARNLPSESYDFHHGLRIALENPDAEERWLKGEDLFAGVARVTLSDPAANEHNRRIIDKLIAGATGKELP